MAMSSLNYYLLKKSFNHVNSIKPFKIPVTYFSAETQKNTLHLEECKKILGLCDNSTLQDAKEAFIKLAKQYHPDSQSPAANAEKFTAIEISFRTVKHSFDQSDDMSEISQTLEKDFGIRHTVPQHRQYLSMDGVGFGTPGQREKQHNRIKVNRAVENVYDYRVNKVEKKEGNETSLFKRDAAMARQYTGKTRQAIERLVEDLILESMSKGEFENLSGMGKPLKHRTENPYVDFTTQKINEIMINNGFTPEWILLEKELRIEKEDLRKELVDKRSNFKVAPLAAGEMFEWEQSVDELRDSTAKLNKRIDKFNMIVPILTKQQIHFRLKQEAKKILQQPPILRQKKNEDEKATLSTIQSESVLDVFWKMLP